MYIILVIILRRQMFSMNAVISKNDNVWQCVDIKGDQGGVFRYSHR